MMAPELRNVLVPAYRCAAFDGACKGMRYDPEHGLFPRGYAGATGALGDIALVLVIAEPGEPPPGASPQPVADADALVNIIGTKVGNAFENGKSPFHRNVRYLIDRCWPEKSYAEQMRRTWITEGVMCSAEVTTGPVPKIVEKECATRYLSKQLALLPDAFVIAVGGKARSRIKLTRRKPHASVFAAGLPGGNFKGAKPSWDAAGTAFRAHLARLNLT